MYGYIYLTTNKINGKQYVGQHAKRNFDTKYKGSGKTLLKAFKKYGKENFECHIIDTAESQEELNNKEFVYVELYQTLETGYNMCEGGGCVSGYKHTEDSKQKMSKVKTGKHRTEDAKQKISETMTGENTGGKNGMAKKCIYNGIEFGSKMDAYNYAKDYCGYDKSYSTFRRHNKG